MKGIQLVLVLVITGLLSACNSGGSSSGGDRTDLYLGTEIITLSSSVVSQSILLDINISIAGDKVTIDDSDGAQFVGKLDDEKLTASGVVTAGDIGNNIFCEDFRLAYAGTINGQNILGTIGGEAICSGIGGSFPFTAVGSFRASLSKAEASASRQHIDRSKGILELMKWMVRQ